MNYGKIANKINELLLNGTENTLVAVKIEGQGYGYYYDLISMAFTKISKNSEMYLLPIKKQEEGKVVIYIPNYHGGGTIIRVNQEEIVYLGFN